MAKMERCLEIHDSPESAERATRRAYQQMTPDERVALTVDLMRRYYSASDTPRRLSRVLEVLERP